MSKGRLEAFSDGVFAILINYYGFRIACPRKEALSML